MVATVDRAGRIGADAIQIFGDNPTAWTRRSAPPDELPVFRARLAELGIGPIAIHASYLVNLAGGEADFHERSIRLLASELRDAPSFAARYVNVHIGSHRGDGEEIGIERLADGVARTLAAVDREPGEAMLVLENSAGSGWGLGVDLDELAWIADAIAARGIADERVGFCLDSAHAWGAGIDVGLPDALDRWLAAFDARIGLSRLVMVHLNDSRSDLGSRLDRHEHLGAGRIGVAGLRHLLRHPGLAHATYYLETPGMDEGYDAVNLDRARAIARGEPLDDLPAEAFSRRSSRSRTAPA